MSGALAAGEFNRLVTIQQPSSSLVSPGQGVDTWSDLASVWARVRPFNTQRGETGREFFAAGAEQSDSAVKFTIRYRADVTNRMRVVWKGRAYAIVADPLDVDGAGHTLELTCTAGVIPG